jgi:hypothetical protein
MGESVSGLPPGYLVAFSGLLVAYLALGELTLDLWLPTECKQRNEHVVLVGYKVISRLAMATIFLAAMIAITVNGS